MVSSYRNLRIDISVDGADIKVILEIIISESDLDTQVFDIGIFGLICDRPGVDEAQILVKRHIHTHISI